MEAKIRYLSYEIAKRFGSYKKEKSFTYLITLRMVSYLYFLRGDIGKLLSSHATKKMKKCSTHSFF